MGACAGPGRIPPPAARPPWLSSPAPGAACGSRRGAAGAAPEHLAQPPVLLGVDLAAGQPLVQDAKRVAAAVLPVIPGLTGPPGGVSEQGVDQPDQQPPERDHPAHIRPACHQAQPPPFQNIIVIISSGPGTPRAATASLPPDTPQG